MRRVVTMVIPSLMTSMSQPRYDEDGNLTGFMIEGARNLKEWHDVDLPLVDEEQAARKKASVQAD